MANPSPDEGVRPALEAAIQNERKAEAAANADRRHINAGGHSHTIAVLEGVLAALSTPVPEEGLLRGSASAAEGDVRAEHEALRAYAKEATAAITSLTAGGSEFFGKPISNIYTADLPFCLERIRASRASLHERLSKAVGDKKRTANMLEKLAEQALHVALGHAARKVDITSAVEELSRLAHAALDGGDGVASALPSPLPSQGEPVAEPAGWRWRLRAEFNGQWGPGPWEYTTHDPEPAEMYEVAPFYTAEALAAERARADRAEEDERDRLYEAALKEVESGFGSLGGRAAANWLETRNAMRKADRAALRARAILKETP